jgi:hypothetical protein
MSRVSRVCVTFIATVVFFTLSQSFLDGQTDSNDLEKLRQQLAQLQSKLDNANVDDIKGGARVRAIGTQKRRAPVAPTVTPMLIRLYDVSDLFAVAPNYPAHLPEAVVSGSQMFAQSSYDAAPRRGGGGFGGDSNMSGGGMGGGGLGGGGGVFNIAPTNPTAKIKAPGFAQKAAPSSMRAAQVSLQQLVSTIKGTVEPEMWGSSVEEARVEFLGNTLLITATENMHRQIQQLLDLFREHWGRRKTVTVQTFFVRATANDVMDLMDEKSNANGAGVVDAKKWEVFREAAATGNRFAYSASVTGHNNQTLHTLSGHQRNLTIDAMPFERTVAGKTERRSTKRRHESEDDDGLERLDEIDFDDYTRTRQIVGFKPIRRSFHDGFAVQMTPMATRGGNFVILDLKAKVNEFLKPAADADRPTVFVEHSKADRIEIQLDSAEYMAYRLNSTIRCPKDKIVLVGGMTHGGNVKSDQPELYVFVKTMVHTIQEDESDWTREPDVNDGK